MLFAAAVGPYYLGAMLQNIASLNGEKTKWMVPFLLTLTTVCLFTGVITAGVMLIDANSEYFWWQGPV